ncbi:uncharacterized protein LOC101846254 [Aplysia californica]|uniref:Uncharacterized protein LOC101846254 n=1 Tax=Aplysia californica TaxID=6500 RepID=A0ABM1W2D2_APLCA|nr:uncharacterized protein LOC101846254 [Aplysia californica]
MLNMNRKKKAETMFSLGHINDGSLMEKEQSCCEPFCAPVIDEDIKPDVSPVVKREPGLGSSTSRPRFHCTCRRNGTESDVKVDIGSVETVVKEEFGSYSVPNLEEENASSGDSGSFDGKIKHNFEGPCNATDEVRQTVENKCIDIKIKDEPLFLFPEEDITPKIKMSPKSADVVEDELQFPDHSLELKLEIQNYYVKQEVLEQECVSTLDRSSEAGGIQLKICDVKSLCAEPSSNPDTDAVVSTVSGSTSDDPALLKMKYGIASSAQWGIEDQGGIPDKQATSTHPATQPYLMGEDTFGTGQMIDQIEIDCVLEETTSSFIHDPDKKVFDPHISREYDKEMCSKNVVNDSCRQKQTGYTSEVTTTMANTNTMDVCCAHSSSVTAPQLHTETHTGQDSATPPVGLEFVTGRRTRAGEKPYKYKCEVCGSEFSQKVQLKVHKRTHTGEKPYNCEVCGATFSRIGHLQIHKRRHTGEKPYKCEVCGLQFAQSVQLKIHKRTHTGEKPYKCEVCGSSFSRNDHLKVHKRRHTGEKPYNCDVCGLRFAQRGSLRIHKRTHTGEKPYNCDVCGLRFGNSSALNRHKRTHTGEKPYKCEVCGSSFGDSCILKQHKKIHTGEKPYKCEVCDKRFTQRGNLKIHERTHTGNKWEICGIVFVPMSNQENHNTYSSGRINHDSLMMEKELSCCELFCVPDIDKDIKPDVSLVVKSLKSEPGLGSSTSRSLCSSDRTDRDVKPDIENVKTVVNEECGSNSVLDLGEEKPAAVVDSRSFDGKVMHNFEVPSNATDDVRQTVENKCIDIEIKNEPLLLFPEEDIKTKMSPKSADDVDLEDEPQFPDHSLELKSEIENYYVKQEVLEQECGSMLDRSSEAGGIQLQICDVRSLCVEQSSNPDTDAVVSTVSGSTSDDPALLKTGIANAQWGIEDQGGIPDKRAPSTHPATQPYLMGKDTFGTGQMMIDQIEVDCVLEETTSFIHDPDKKVFHPHISREYDKDISCSKSAVNGSCGLKQRGCTSEITTTVANNTNVMDLSCAPSSSVTAPQLPTETHTGLDSATPPVGLKFMTFRRTRAGEKPYKCEVYVLRFGNRGQLNSHKRTHTGEKPYKCEVCAAAFARSSGLKQHKRRHTGEKPYKCEVCDLQFAQCGSLKIHKRTHTGEKPYKCEVCDLQFAQCGSLKSHKRTHTGEKPYKCEVCGLRFGNGSALNRHKKTHTGEKPYMCDVCAAAFASSSGLKQHKRRHTGEKPYICEVCGLGFACSSGLWNHQKVHTGEKPHKCEVCGSGFAFRNDLKRHQRKHTGEKPYKCEVCGLLYADRKGLKIHKRTHSGEKPYKCKVCDKGFAHNKTLKHHEKTHT